MMYKYSDDEIVMEYVHMPEGIIDLYYTEDYELACMYVSKLLHVRLGIARDVVHSIIPYLIRRYSIGSDPHPFIPNASFLVTIARRTLERGNKVYLLWESLEAIQDAASEDEVDPKYLQIWKGHSDLDFSWMIWDAIPDQRDRVIARMRAEGARYAEIAAQLHISVYVVFRALQRVRRALQAAGYHI